MARESLMEVLKINEDQARAILEMQLQRLVGMETEKSLERLQNYQLILKTTEIFWLIRRNWIKSSGQNYWL